MPEVASISHGIGAAAFLGISILLFLHKSTRQKVPWVILGCLFTGIWSALASLYGFNLLANYQWVAFSEVIQDGSWCLALIHMITGASQQEAKTRRTRLTLLLTVGLSFLMVNALLIHQQWLPGMTSSFIQVDFLGHLALSILGLSLIEQLYRGVKPQRRWGVKFFCLSIGALFGYDFYMYAHALLFEQLNVNLWYARGGINLFVAPIIALAVFRNNRWDLDVAPSRVLIYRSTIIVGCGLYLLSMSVIGYLIRAVGGHWGKALSILFLFGAAILLFSVLFSGKARAYIKLMMARHVFKLYYDYREEWLRFSQLLGRADSEISLSTRVIMAFAAMVESPEGLLLDRREHGFEVKDYWNVKPKISGFNEAKEITFLQNLENPLLVSELHQHGEIGERISNKLCGFVRAWLIVPLYLEDRIEALVVLGRPRVRVDINWEVSDLLVTAARQAAVFLHQQKLASALAVAKQFESYHQISAFMLHDIKNLLSSTQLILQNKKHASDPRFVETIFITLESIHSKLSKLQNQLHQPSEGWTCEVVDIYKELIQIQKECQLAAKDVQFDQNPLSSASAVMDREAFKHCVMHLIDNGLQASNYRSGVKISLEVVEARLRVSIIDQGVGMSQHFVNNDLFKPFVTTKGQKGMGIGVFQVKSFAQRAKGMLLVESEEGVGSTFIIDLPLYIKAKSETEQSMLEELV